MDDSAAVLLVGYKNVYKLMDSPTVYCSAYYTERGAGAVPLWTTYRVVDWKLNFFAKTNIQ